MEEDINFPLLPDDKRFLVALERWRKYVPPASAPAPAAYEPPPRSPASLAAERILSLYMRSPRPRLASSGGTRRTWPRSVWLRGQLAQLAWNVAATGMLPVTTMVLCTCRPELRGTALRAALWRSEDLERIVGGWLERRRLRPARG